MLFFDEVIVAFFLLLLVNLNRRFFIQIYLLTYPEFLVAVTYAQLVVANRLPT